MTISSKGLALRFRIRDCIRIKHGVRDWESDRMRRCTAVSILQMMSLCLVASSAFAQQSGGTIVGIVRDGLSKPVADADVIAHPGAHRAHTDSTGRFTLTGLSPDNYTVRARKVGFLPESWDVKLNKASKVDITIVLDRQLPVLDTVRIRADASCPQKNIEAFVCRRGRSGGVFLDYLDIDEKERTYVGELFRDMPGFRVDFQIVKSGPAYTVSTAKPSGCITPLVDGRPLSGTNLMPELTSTLIALEIYQHPDSVPAEFERYTWPRGDLSRSGRCTVVVYWTNRRI